jgi:signal transduction histidine kinase
VVATGLVAVAFEPLRRRVQRGVDRLLYGDRDDPYEVIARLGQLQGLTVEPNALLPLLTASIARSLQVPYVAVEVNGPSGPRRVAERGESNAPLDSFDMFVRGEPIGQLLVAPRSSSSRFSPRERRLLQDAALHAGVAAQAARLIRDLQDSRERLVMAREEERRRLRGDLHDGLGPTLAGMSMQVRAAQRLSGEQTRAGRIMDTLAEDLRTCTRDLRVLVDELRPPALDSGLEASLRAQCRRFEGSLSVRLEVCGDLEALPAAVEVAAYRIVAESLTNVVRHAQARACVVNVRRCRFLTLEITDDGVGIASEARRGVGLESMRERAEELNGHCEVRPNRPHGTTVWIQFPIVPAVPITHPVPGQR